MLTTIRRGPTFLNRSLALLSTSFQPRLSSNSPRPFRLLEQLSSQPQTRSFHSTPQWSRNATAAAVAEEKTMEDEELFDEEELEQKRDRSSYPSRGSPGTPVTKFQELGDRKMVSATLIRTLTHDMKLDTMTQVQSMTINEILKGVDVYAKVSRCSVFPSTDTSIA